ncbi:transporter substrate-binding domain-containing protein [Chitinibacter sp. SCUT-21]|uniref:substrate-binding periplasmic protein n=1 Tax=Chitinibacter sp. SCUT-21 TaxID=2970891 RepID=UPI0035A620AA
MIARSVFGAVIGVLLLWSPLVAAFDCGQQPIKVAFYQFGLLYDQGKGIDKDVIDELQKRTRCQFAIQVMPRARIWADLASGQLDMSVSAVATPEREQFARFIPYLAGRNRTILDKKTAARVKTAEQFLQLKEAQFAAVRSIKHGKDYDLFLDQLRMQQRVQDSPDLDATFSKLREGRVQGIFAQSVLYRYELRKLNMEQQVEVQNWFPNDQGVKAGLVLAKSRFSAEQAQAWQSQIIAMRTDGTLYKICRQYLPEAEVMQLLDF